jgi:hypothetical protein
VVESTEPLIPEIEAALHTLEAKHRQWWVALFLRVTGSVPVTVILNTIWSCWPLNTGDLGWLTLFMVNALGGLGMSAWRLRYLRQGEATDRQWKLQGLRWQTQDRAWHQQWEERRGHLRKG